MLLIYLPPEFTIELFKIQLLVFNTAEGPYETSELKRDTPKVNVCLDMTNQNCETHFSLP